jgi:hypothetical protein
MAISFYLAALPIVEKVGPIGVSLHELEREDLT